MLHNMNNNNLFILNDSNLYIHYVSCFGELKYYQMLEKKKH